ncbi:MAG: Zn-dependent exopeptidase M28 [Clostridiaceae bacterium]|nr:Zn-dependent exopeptidase M28 [Clostridiaceae bacterium]
MIQKATLHHRAEWRRHCLVYRLFAVLIALLLLLPLLTACSGEEEEASEIAAYGEEGARFARKLAATFPRRVPYSDQESGAADLIMEELRKYGYEPEKQTFSVADEEGLRQTSVNVIARLEGSGFGLTKKQEETDPERLPEEYNDLVMVIGAHYDTPAAVLVDEAENADDQELVLPDGIHNNASGVASVLTAARILRQEHPGYDIVFVFFGAGTDEYRGARHYLSSLSPEDRGKIDVMINIGPIYAGDKVYAHAGQNSVRSGKYKDYAKRRKLYQVTDIFFEFQLNSRNRYAVYTNQASFFVTLDSGEQAVFREWTSKLSDHTPFDQADIPVVFMESGDYRVKTMEDVTIESRNPYFQDTGGVISGTRFDRIEVLEELFRQMDEQTAGQTIPAIDPDDLTDDEPDPEPDSKENSKQVIVPRLVQRINNTAFVLVQLTRKGPLNYDFKD